MPEKSKITHTVVKEPRLSVSRLADYMAASEQGKRAIIQSCKYRAKARVLQHNEARGIVSNFLMIPNRKLALLNEKLETMEARFFDEPFDTELNEHNCDLIRHFIRAYERLGLPDAEYKFLGLFPPLPLHGTSVSFRPQAIVARTTRRNTRKIGAVMLRYAKSKSLPQKAADHQSAFIYSYLKQRPFEEQSEPERPLCVTVDVKAGKPYEAPSNSVYLFNEMSAACASIAERWPAIKPPSGAVLE